MRKRILILAVFLGAAAGGALMLSKCTAQEGPTPLVQGVKTDKDVYPLGEDVTITFEVRNNGNKPITLNFPSSKQHDIWITYGSTEVYRLSAGKMYATVITRLKLEPGETKTFTDKWNQKDGQQDVGPGSYTVHAQLTSSRNPSPAVTSTFKIGRSEAMLIPVTIKQAIDGVDQLRNQRVAISAVYKGWQPDPTDPNTKDGPPVTRSDWAISDKTGGMYVNGYVNLDPQNDVGAKITAVGKLRKTGKGQVYLVSEGVTVGR